MRPKFDINCEEAQKMMQHQRDALNLFVSRFPKMSYCETATTGNYAYAVIDAIFLKDDVVAGIAEVKTRYVTHSKFINDYKNLWLISQKKIDNCKKIADFLNAPFWGFLYLEPDNLLLYIKIYDPFESTPLSCELIVQEWTTTGPLINEKKKEPCAFINMEDAYVIKGEKSCQT